MWFFLEFAFAGISTVLIYLLVRSFLQSKGIEFTLSNSIIAVFALKFLTVCILATMLS